MTLVAPSYLDRPLCPVPGCERTCQLSAKPGTFGGKYQYLKTCHKHSVNDLLAFRAAIKQTK